VIVSHLDDVGDAELAARFGRGDLRLILRLGPLFGLLDGVADQSAGHRAHAGADQCPGSSIAKRMANDSARASAEQAAAGDALFRGVIDAQPQQSKVGRTQARRGRMVSMVVPPGAVARSVR